MKPCLLEEICCPRCRGDFHLSVFEGGGSTVDEGLLSCVGCGTAYPVIKGVPRILAPELCLHLVTGYREFLERHRDDYPERPGAEPCAGVFAGESIAIGKGFEIEWRAHHKILPEHELELVHVMGDLLSKEDFAGKTVLDAGCGQGRFLFFAHAYGARVVHGFDLSESVLVAQENLRGIDRVHLIQASIYALPYRKRFDLAISIGVVHHLPDPAGGVRILAELLGAGGELLVWVYGQSGIVPVLRFLRTFSLRMPLGLMKYLSALPASVIYVTNRIHDVLHWAGLRFLADKLPFSQYNDRGFNGLRYGVCYDHLTTKIVNFYTRDELLPWVNEGTFSDFKVVERYPGIIGSSWRVWGRKRTPPSPQ